MANMKDDATITTVPPFKPAEPYFIVPPGFRANTYFVGMEKELRELDRCLFDRRRREGTACVLLHGQPGGGKSHLARQYVHKHRKKFPGGIFWVQAKLKEEIQQAFWNIHQKAVMRELAEECVKVNGDERSWVGSVKAWFEARHEWLIVFDGLVVDKEEDATDLQRFIPDSKNSSIIYVSRAKSLESRQRLLRPFAIRVPPLKEADARRLLFKELHIKKPSEAETKSATELVRKIGGLPLAINAISHRLADTHEPLAKYNLKSYSADPRVGGTYNKILDDLQRLGHMEAWNLINILCFFGQHIPVEMLCLGLKALRSYPIEVKSTEDDRAPDINTTFSILMRYALIERNEPDDKDNTSSSRDSLVGPEPIDMLKVHSVVQKFCCDSLNERKLLPEWLEYAARLFAYSYKQADVKIKQISDTGRVSDYRYYLVHGRRLLDNCTVYGSKDQPLKEIREELEPILGVIDEEIRTREPSSSQERVSRDVFQISIFDRTSSSSESGPSILEARTPDHRPTPLPLAGQNLYGLAIDKPSIDSPASLRTVSSYAGPRIVANSPELGHLHPQFDDDGYQSDREGPFSPSLMQKNPSEATARPTSSLMSHDEGWQVVPSTKKSRKLRPRRDLGSYRPSPAVVEVNTKSAFGSVSGRIQRSRKQTMDSNNAVTALAQVHERSSPPSRPAVRSFWQWGQSDPGPSSNSTRPTYAGVLAREPQVQQSTDTIPPMPAIGNPPPTSAEMERGRSDESRYSQQDNRVMSPLNHKSTPRSESARPAYHPPHQVYNPPLANFDLNNSGHSPLSPQQPDLQQSISTLSDSSYLPYPDENINQPYISPSSMAAAKRFYPLNKTSPSPHTAPPS